MRLHELSVHSLHYALVSSKALCPDVMRLPHQGCAVSTRCHAPSPSWLSCIHMQLQRCRLSSHCPSFPAEHHRPGGDTGPEAICPQGREGSAKRWSQPVHPLAWLASCSSRCLPDTKLTSAERSLLWRDWRCHSPQVRARTPCMHCVMPVKRLNPSGAACEDVFSGWLMASGIR